MMMHMYNVIAYFFLYGFLGWGLEVAYATTKERQFVNRGFLNGPICPIYGVGVVIVVELLTRYKASLLILFVASVVLVSTLEWVTGFLLEKIFHNKWWDYSDMPLNINGYICLPFSIMWGIICVFIVDVFHPMIVYVLHFIPWMIGAIVLVVLVVILFIDLIQTATGIFKMNHNLDHMEYITNQLHEISNQIGEEIYKNTIEMMDQHQDLSEEMKHRISELYTLRRDITSRILDEEKISRRLIRAFPKMKVPKQPKIITELRNQYKKRRK